jgi:hypothetical protein
MWWNSMFLKTIFNSVIVLATKGTNTFGLRFTKLSSIDESFGIIKRKKIALSFVLKNHGENLVERWKRIYEKDLRLHGGEILVQTGQETDRVEQNVIKACSTHSFANTAIPASASRNW